MRFTKIIATLGPSVTSRDGLRMLAENGMNVARLNFSHGDHESHGRNIELLKSIRKHGHTFGILLDTKGPEIRTGDVKTPIEIRKNQEVVFTPSIDRKERRVQILVNYNKFSHDVRKAEKILIDNGEIEFTLVKIAGKKIIARAKNSGVIGSRRHVNLPGANISLPSFTKKDWEDIHFGIKHKVEFIAPSFIRSSKDIEDLRNFLNKNKSTAQIIAKIETAQAVSQIDKIIDVTDGIMIARGDLGVEIPFEKIPRLQDEIILKCRQKGKIVIVATQMLESMIENPMPTRAEVTDVAHATMTFADSTMLSGETAAGKFPKESIQAMARVIKETEEFETETVDALVHLEPLADDPARREQARAACVLAKNLDAKAIVVITKRGNTARAVSRYRPFTPILAFTDAEYVCHQLALSWGVNPSLITLSRDPEKTVQAALKLAKKKNLLKEKDTIIIVSDIFSKLSPETHGFVMTVQIRRVP